MTVILPTDRLCFLGDSITEGVGTEKAYWAYIAEKTGAEVHSFGVNGAVTIGLFSQMDRLEQTVGKDFDVLFVMIGTNDFYGCVPIGKWFSECEEKIPCNSDGNGNFTAYTTRKKRELLLDDTFCGRLNRVFSQIRTRFFDKRIVLMTPIHRAYAYFGGTNIQPNELYANGAGVFFDEYVRSVREAADIWSLELVDLYRDSGLFPLEDGNAARYFHSVNTDRLHPNTFGHERIAETILRRI
ncbi:MAG TPA: G-D-S-L family lipolytic protein [Ruminococcaceae bacterium]|nr:G-D-S-L family lipolytic protein [Oscillospiraceae bacterium]